MLWSAQPPHKASPVDCVPVSGFYLALQYKPSEEKTKATLGGKPNFCFCKHTCLCLNVVPLVEQSTPALMVTP